MTNAGASPGLRRPGLSSLLLKISSSLKAIRGSRHDGNIRPPMRRVSQMHSVLCVCIWWYPAYVEDCWLSVNRPLVTRQHLGWFGTMSSCVASSRPCRSSNTRPRKGKPKRAINTTLRSSYLLCHNMLRPSVKAIFLHAALSAASRVSRFLH